MKRWCGLPTAAVCAVLAGLGLLGLYFCMIYSSTHWSNKPADESTTHLNESTTQTFLVTGGLLLFGVMIVAAYPLALTFAYLTFLRPKAQIRRAVAALNRLQFEGLMQKLKREVSKITEIVHRLDSYTRSQTRMVVFVDGLDSCEQDRMLQTLDAIQILFGSKQNSPFIVLIAVDPHIVVTAIQHVMHSAFTATDISGHDYLKNLIQMPFYLQNTAIRKLHEKLRKRSDSGNDSRFAYLRHENAFGSKLSIADSYRSSTRLRRGVSQQLYVSDAFSQRFIRDDYFSNINPRSMRRIVNTLALTGRLMRAFEIDFNWVALGHWVSLGEQWPYRLSWIIDYCERQQPHESVTLHDVYEIIKHKIPAAKSEDPLIEIDRNPRNLEIYLESSRDQTLTVGHLQQFVPFTSNLDPYVRKLIHERFDGTLMAVTAPSDAILEQLVQQQTLNEAAPDSQKLSIAPSVGETTTGVDLSGFSNQAFTTTTQPLQRNATPPRERMPMGLEQFFKDAIWQVRISCLTVDEVCSLIKRLPLSNASTVDTMCQRFREINASGLVLSVCDLDQLKAELRATFGDWELIALMIRTLRSRERDCGHLDDAISRAQSVEPSVMGAPIRKYSGGYSTAMAANAIAASVLSRRRASNRPARKKTLTQSGNTTDYNSSSDQVAEVAAQQDWLHHRLSHLDSAEFVGDRDLVDYTPRTSRRSSIIREETMGFASETNSYEDVMSPLSTFAASPGQVTRELSPTMRATAGVDATQAAASTQTPAVVVSEEDRRSSLTQRLKGLMQSVGGGSNEEKGRLLVVQSSDTEDEEEKTQLTVKCKPAEEPRPSVFQMVQTTRASSVPNVNTVGVDSLMEIVTASSANQTSLLEKSANGDEEDTSETAF